MNRRLSHLLLAVLLLCAQALAAVHAIEHSVEEGKGAPTHVCELCLAAHDLGTALPGSVASVPISSTHFVFLTHDPAGRSSLPPPYARQQSPPRL